MLYPDFIYAFIIAFILSLFFSWLLQRGGPRKGIFWFFLIVFLGAWAGGIWMRPFGPAIWGVYWLSFLLFGIFCAILLAVTAPGKPPANREETIELLENEEKREEVVRLTYVSLSLTFWVAVFVLIAAIIARYLFLSA